MSGLYPDVPSWRIPWDKDGTQLYAAPDFTSAPTRMSDATMLALNDDNKGTWADFNPWSGTYANGIFLLFPQPMNLYGGFLRAGTPSGGNWNGISTVQASPDTTNGVDGTWSTWLPGSFGQWTDTQDYRTGIAVATALNVKGIRFNAGNLYNKTCSACHLFGEIASGNPDRLEIWHPTLDERAPAAWFDMGECPRSSSQDVQFRIKNMSPTLTANSVVTSLEALTDTTPSVPASHFLSTDGVTFLSSATVASILPGAISAILTLRRTTPSNAVLSLWDFRMKAIATSWS